jgi:hypothetical protein
MTLRLGPLGLPFLPLAATRGLPFLPLGPLLQQQQALEQEQNQLKYLYAISAR